MFLMNLTSQEQKKLIKEIKDKGITVIPDIVPEALVSKLNKFVKSSIKDKDYSHLAGSTAGHLNFSFGNMYIDEMKDKIIGIIMPIAKEYLNSKTVTVSIGCNVNMPNSVYQHWHSDSDFNDNWLVTNCLLEDFTDKNGPTNYVVGTHKKYISYIGYLLRKIFNNFKIEDLSGHKKGTIVIRDSNLWHRGGKNNSNNSRVMLTIVFHRSDIVITSTSLSSGPNINELEGINKEDAVFSAAKKSGLYGMGFFAKKPKWLEVLYVKVPIIYSLKRFISALKSLGRENSN